MQVSTADEAVELVANQAIRARQQGTFAVGGALIDNASGDVVAAMHNNVLMPMKGSTAGFLLHDPTAHGERQLVDWYFDNKGSLELPVPGRMTVVTTLDPCAMCAGALLTARFNVGVSAIDDFAGINFDSNFDFPSLPPTVRTQAQKTFGYYGVDDPCAREYVGSTSTIFAKQTVRAVSYLLTSLVFSSGVDNIRAESNGFATDPRALADPATLPQQSPVRGALAALYAQTLQVRSSQPRFPAVELAEPLLNTAQAAANAGSELNAVALIDPFGNLLTCTGGRENHSPVRTAFLEATRNYAQLRWTLMNDPSPAVRAEASQYLTHAKYCTFVHLVAPDPACPQAVLAFGAYGSTMEAAVPQPFPSSFQYVALPAGVTATQVAELAASLPPLYVDLVGVAPQQVLDPALRLAVDPLPPPPPVPPTK